MNSEKSTPTSSNENNNNFSLENVLLDTRFMCSRVIRKINNLLCDLNTKKSPDVEKQLGILFDKIVLNIKAFKEGLNIDTETVISERSPKRVSLSLKKTKEEELDLTEEDNDLHTSVILPDDFIVKNEPNLENEPVSHINHRATPESFDFDEIEVVNDDKKAICKEDSPIKENSKEPEPVKTEKPSAEITENNELDDLLMLLTKVTDVDDDLHCENEVIDDKAAEDALLSLESSSSSSSDETDSISNLSDLSLNSNKDTINKKQSNSDTNRTEPNIQTDFKIKLVRLEDLEDNQINRLCDLNNINKRKLTSNVNLPKAKRLKGHIPLPATSSSESDTMSNLSRDFSDLDDSDESLNSIRNITFSQQSDDSNHIENLAEMFCCFTSDEGSDNDSDIEEKKQKKKLKLENTVVVEEITKIDDDFEVIKSENEENFDPSALPKKTNLDITELSDLDLGSDDEIKTISSENDSDVEFIMEGSFEESSKGRRNIREILSDDELNQETRRAKQEEDKRIERLEKISKTREEVLSQCLDFDELILDIDAKAQKPSIVVDKNLTKKLKPHQRTGIQFMWDICYESVKMCQTNPGTGCILAHSMGLGKTLQVITLIHTLFAYPTTKTKRVLIVCPLSVVSNWHREFRMAFALTERKIKINIFPIEKADLDKKLQIIKEWLNFNGVLIIGYESFQILTCDKTAEKLQDRAVTLKQALVDPGPDLIVCDEGHILKNGKTFRTQALMKVKTKRRIVLTGTPLQNNLQEYYFMVQFVKPNLLGTFEEYKNRFVNPITNGQYFDSTPQDIKLMKQRTHILAKVLKKTIDRVESKVLEKYLPKIFDHTVFVTMHPIQEELYKNYIDIARNLITNTPNRRSGFLSHFQISKLITLHPWVIDYYYKNKKRVLLNTENPEIQSNLPKEDWYKNCTTQDQLDKVEYGTKMAVVLRIIDETIAHDDKLLIFSSSLFELDCIEHFLKKHGTQMCSEWKLNKNYCRMDGTIPPEKRSNICAVFNSKSNNTLKVFLITHKVGGLGLNLTAANRVIIIGANFNPSYDTQSIYRVYRFGQVKNCYIYRILTIGTMEEKIYNRCVVKLALAGTVVDKKHIDRHFTPGDLEELYQHDFAAFRNRPIPAVPQDTLLAKLLNTEKAIYKFLEHDALLLNRPEEELNDEEKKLAWEEFNNMEQQKNQDLLAATTALQNINQQIFTTLAQPRCTPRILQQRQMIPPRNNKFAPAGNNYIPLPKLNNNGVGNGVQVPRIVGPPPPNYQPGPSGVQFSRANRYNPKPVGNLTNRQLNQPTTDNNTPEPVEFNYYLNKGL